MRYTMLLAAGLLGGMASLQGCDELNSPSSEALLAPDGQDPSADPLADPSAADKTVEGLGLELTSGKTLSPELCAPNRGGFTLESENDYFPIGVGSRWVFEGEEDGVAIRLQKTVLNQTEVVAGVRTRVIEEREWQDGELFEVALNYFAIARDETACYFGEAVDFYENGKIVSHEGSWRADAPGAAPGIIMPADPRLGQKFQMERAPGIAEDTGTIVRVGQTVRVPAGRFKETIRVKEVNPLDGDIGFKWFAEDVGLLVDGPSKLVRFHVTGERDD
jgi:hypothetical protein